MPPRRTTARSGRTTAPRRKSRAGVRSSNRTGKRSTRAQRFGPFFFTVVAVTGLCALAFLGLIATAMAGA